MDYAAATPVDAEIMKAMEPYFSNLFYNPAASYDKAREARRAISEAKSVIGAAIGVKPTEIVLSSGGTEANNLAISGVMEQSPGKKIVASAVEHESVREPAKKYEVLTLPVDEKGVLDVERASELIDDECILVSVMLANNEVGSIQPVKQLADEIEKIRRGRKARKVSTPLIFHTDACQAPLYLDINPHRLGVDLMTVNGGKTYGPKQSGALWVRAGLRLKPLLVGGGQQRGLRSGTESPAAAIGLASALKGAQLNRPAETKRLIQLQNYFIGELQNKFPEAVINGSLKKRLPNNIHITFPGVDNERLINELDEVGIMVAAGSACSAASTEPSHVLKAMGKSNEEAQSSIRLTMGRFTIKEDLDYTLEVLQKLI